MSKSAVALARGIANDCRKILGPPDEGILCSSQHVIPMSVVRGTRGYIEKVANQANGCYANGWYDSCAVMIRRLVETLIIEAFEAHQLATKIKGTTDDFLYLSDLISATLGETSWNLGRNTKKALPRLKDIGDKSAHSRRFIAHQADIDKVIGDLRVVVQELVYLAKLK